MQIQVLREAAGNLAAILISETGPQSCRVPDVSVVRVLAVSSYVCVHGEKDRRILSSRDAGLIAQERRVRLGSALYRLKGNKSDAGQERDRQSRLYLVAD